MAKKSATKRKPNAAFMKPVTPSPQLADGGRREGNSADGSHEEAVAVHQEERSAGQKNRRMINADAKLKVVFGGKASVNMFAMTKLVSKHLK